MNIVMFELDACLPNYINARRLAETLTAAGHSVRIIAFKDQEMPGYEEIDGYTIIRLSLLSVYFVRHGIVPSLSPFFHRISDSGKPGEIAAPATKPLISKVISSISLNIYRILIHALYLEYYLRSFLLIRRSPANVYHAHDLVTLPVAWVCSRITKGKLIYDAHELWLDQSRIPPRSRIEKFLEKQIESFLIRRTDANIMAGISSARELCRRYSIPDMTVILNAPRYRPFKRSNVIREELSIPDSQKVLIYIGGWSIHRGLEEMIQSLTLLPNCHLVMLGWGTDSYVSSLKALMQSCNVTDRVHLHPPVPKDDVTQYAMSADVGLILYHNTELNLYYCSPNKLFESMGAGLPTVASNFPDLKHFVEGYHFGVTCNPESPQDIARAVNDILSSPERQSQMRANALEAAKIFNWENEEKKLLAIYKGLEL
jgi:glycosyltransferase involved in cell wall biosynthesis